MTLLPPGSPPELEEIARTGRCTTRVPNDSVALPGEHPAPYRLCGNPSAPGAPAEACADHEAAVRTEIAEQASRAAERLAEAQASLDWCRENAS